MPASACQPTNGTAWSGSPATPCDRLSRRTASSGPNTARSDWRCDALGQTGPHLLFDPIELLERLAALTPRPRVNLILYHGVLGARAAWRSLVGQYGTTDGTRPTGDSATAVEEPAPQEPHAGGNYLWADLMRRSLALDVLARPRCGGRLRLIAVVDNPAVVARILRHLGLPTEVSGTRPARAPPTEGADLFVAADPA